uniref:Histone deacetylase 10 n=1 Tax=Labrus bergylta TaxID=56723 RepID=A0A3Q3F9K0_9LABR
MGTALIHDEEMTKYKLLWVDPACKIEVPERLTVTYEALIQNGLTDRCVSVPVREATDADILLVHSEEYLEAVKKTPYMTLEDLKEFTLQYGDVYFHPNIYHCAKLAAGAALQLVDSVMTGKVRNGMALVRPPGHHSMRSAANGFCVFNNVAIAARYAKQKYGLKRVLIVDWDVHHGQGGAVLVLYFSWHRYEHQKFWPQLRESDYDSVGKDKGAGFNINVPWNQVGMKNSDYLSLFCHVLLPVAYEGGYNLTSLPQSVCQTVQTLLGDPAPRPANLDGPCESALESLHCVRSAHRQYWSSLKHAVIKSFHMNVFFHLIRETLLKAEADSVALATLSSLIALVEKMEKNEVQSGYHACCVFPIRRDCRYRFFFPLLTCLHELQADVIMFNDFSSDLQWLGSGRRCGCSDALGFTQAVLSLLLPLGYEYDPSLVLLVRMSDSGVCDNMWQQLTGLLLGLAQGRTLVLMQVNAIPILDILPSSLLGDAAPSLRQLDAPLPEDVEALERLRHRLQADWKLLQTTGEHADAILINTAHHQTYSQFPPITASC